MKRFTFLLLIVVNLVNSSPTPDDIRNALYAATVNYLESQGEDAGLCLAVASAAVAAVRNGRDQNEVMLEAYKKAFRGN